MFLLIVVSFGDQEDLGTTELECLFHIFYVTLMFPVKSTSILSFSFSGTFNVCHMYEYVYVETLKI